MVKSQIQVLERSCACIYLFFSINQANMTTIVFPGQGSQYKDMAMDFNDNFQFSKKLFDEIEEYVGINIREIISSNPDDKLNKTNFTQITIFSASIVIYKTLINEFGIEKINPEIVMGHSLGEYTALVANNTLKLSDASKLIKKRGILMNSAIKPNISGMAAIIGKNADYINQIIKKHNLNIQIANDNSPMQVVISGLTENINDAEKIFISEGVKRYVKLNVSAAFHSKYMLEAQKTLYQTILNTNFSKPDMPIISNFSAKITNNLDEIIHSLSNQMASQVKWTDSILTLEKTKNFSILEIGPGKVLSGLISRISKKFDITSVDKVDDLQKLKL